MPLSNKNFDHLREVIEQPELGGSKYELIKKIASGGMGVVYLARETELQRLVALKVLSLTNDSAEMIKRLRREARILAKLEHPGIVPIHDIVELPDGRVFYTMKYVQGDTLERYRSSSTDISDLLAKFRRICDAVAFAHSKNVIHRDLKPANIMVGSFGEALVMDWGIAVENNQAEKHVSKSQNKGESNVQTAKGAILGTPGYMSPEQAEGRLSEVDLRSDIYSLGAILSFLLTGSAPGDSEQRETLVVEAKGLALPDKSRRRLDAIAYRALRAKPSDRYQNVNEMSADIACYLAGSPVSAYQESVIEKLDGWLARNRFIVLILLAYVVVRILLLFFFKI